MSRRLTDSAIKAAIDAATAANRPAEIADETRGLVLRILPSGTASWGLIYSLDGKRRRLALGRYRATDAGTGLTLAEARRAAATARTRVDAGEDPALEREAERARLSEEVAARKADAAKQAARIDMAELVKQFTAAQKRRGVRSWKENTRSLKKELTSLGSEKVADVAPEQLDKVIRKVEDREAYTEAARLYGRLSTLFAFAIERHYVEASPLDKVAKRTSSKPRKRVLAPHEVRAFLVDLPNAPMTDQIRNILRLQLLLLRRVDEVAGMRKFEIDLVDDVWHIPPERSKNEEGIAVPLPPEARLIIEAAMKASSHPTLVFPNKKSSQAVARRSNRPPEEHIPNHVVAKALKRAQTPTTRKAEDGRQVVVPPVYEFRDAEVKLSPFTSHDLRRTGATGLQALGFPDGLIAAVLNHVSTKNKSVTGRHYAHADVTDLMYDALVKWQWAVGEMLALRDPFAVDTTSRRERARETLGVHATLQLTAETVDA